MQFWQNSDSGPTNNPCTGRVSAIFGKTLTVGHQIVPYTAGKTLTLSHEMVPYTDRVGINAILAAL